MACGLLRAAWRAARRTLVLVDLTSPWQLAAHAVMFYYVLDWVKSEGVDDFSLQFSAFESSSVSLVSKNKDSGFPNFLSNPFWGATGTKMREENEKERNKSVEFVFNAFELPLPDLLFDVLDALVRDALFPSLRAV